MHIHVFFLTWETLKKVTVGIKVDDMVEILSGLEGNEKVVTKGQTLLNNGTKVNIVSLTEEKIEEK